MSSYRTSLEDQMENSDLLRDLALQHIDELQRDALAHHRTPRTEGRQAIAGALRRVAGALERTADALAPGECADGG
ncbi:MAG: hypothetical protein ABI346_04275 [Candidatus Baltobacteraceae bacterium]